MLKISERPRIDTNHWIQATCITLLSEAGFEGRHIITISGHCSEEIIKSYCRDTSNEQKRDMSKSISNFTIVEITSNTIDVSKEESNSKSTENWEFDTVITEDELVLTTSQTDSLINQIVENEVPLQDITNIQPLNSEIGRLKASGSSLGMIFHDCSMTINMQQMWNERSKRFYDIKWILSVLFQNWRYTLFFYFLYMKMFWLLIWKKYRFQIYLHYYFLYATVLLAAKYLAN